MGAAIPKRVTVLSRVDRERLAAGEISFPEEALQQYAAQAQPVAGRKAPHNGRAQETAQAGSEAQLTALDREILANVPPHFGKI